MTANAGSPSPDAPGLRESGTPFRRRFLLWIARIAICAAALLLSIQAARMNDDWIDQHILPDLLMPSTVTRATIEIERLLLVLIAVLLIARVRPYIERSIEEQRLWKASRRCLGFVFLCLLAIPASQAVLRFVIHPGDKVWFPNGEPLRMPDPVTGWVIKPGRVGIEREYSPPAEYALDRNGYRVPFAGRNTDFAAPSILFLGESVMVGRGLNWQASTPGQVQAMTGIQAANLAVGSYSAAQTYLHLRRELGKFRRPVAVVILFAPTLMRRDLDRARPWLDSNLRRHEPVRLSRLSHLVHVLLPYYSPSAVREAEKTDRRILQAEAALAAAHGVRPLFLVPVFQPESPLEKKLKEAVLDKSRVDYVEVSLDAEWRLFPDRHPDARADRAMAIALVQRLTGLGILPFKATVETP